MKRAFMIVALVVLGLSPRDARAQAGDPSLRFGNSSFQVTPAEQAVQAFAEARRDADLATVRAFRPAYAFWQHLFAIPDGRIILGSAQDGRLLATLPLQGDWTREADWQDASFRALVVGKPLPRRLSDRRDELVRLLEPTTGPLVHNPTRGNFLLPNVARYGPFLSEWATIYERFGVPADVGLSQAVLESGLNGQARSGASALGLCQFLKRNWAHLNRITTHTIEAFNQTTQAPYCAAYLSVLATMYGSYIPALSEHHSGGVNVGRVVINGERLGGGDAREQYFLGSDFARGLRGIALNKYKDLYRTYGPRSFRYAEMVFGNALTVTRLAETTPQVRIFAMRTSRAWSLAEITRQTGLSADQVKRFNPAIIRQVPARADLYLPSPVAAFGPDVSFWHRAASPEYASLLNEFLRLESGVQRWHDPSFQAVLQGFERRFRGTATDEGLVMASTLTYVLNDLRTRRGAILEEFRTSTRIQDLFAQGLRILQASLTGSE
ncbi:MAG: transglycosylase SLT domain-containing protein [Vicinamibacterales bacterium]